MKDKSAVPPAAAARKAPASPPNSKPAPPPVAARTVFLTFLGICAAAFLIRLVYLYEIQAVVFFHFPVSDGRAYDIWSQRIAAGEWLGTGVFYQAPLYPYFLAVAQLLVGHDYWWLRVVQIALGAVSCGFLFLAGRLFFSYFAGLIAGLILALYPPAIFFDGLLQKAVLDLFGMTLLLWLAARALQRPSAARWAAAGAALGLLTLTRENALLLAPVLAAALAVFHRESRGWWRLWRPGAFLAGFALLVLPVALRNQIVGGEFALTTSQAGPNFYIGNNPQAVGVYIPLRGGRGDPFYERRDATELAEKAVGRQLTPAEVSRYWFGQAWEFIRTQPSAWLKLMGRKTFLLFNTYEIPDAEDLYYYEKHSRLLRTVGMSGLFSHFGMLCPLAAVGLALTWPLRRRLWFLYVLLATLAVGVVLFYVFARYRYPLVPTLVLFTAAGVMELLTAIRAGQARRLVVAVAVFVPALIGANWAGPFPKADGIAVSHTNAADALERQGRYQEAAREAVAALQLNPGIVEAHLNLAQALLRLGQRAGAQKAYEAARRATSNPTQVDLEFAAALLKVGDAEAARELLQKALERAPDDPWILHHLGRARLQLGQWGPAIQALRRSLERAPDQMDFVRQLAWALSVCPDPALRDAPTALRLAETLRAAGASDDPQTFDVLAAVYAAAGRFEEAVQFARQALRRAAEPAHAGLRRGIQSRLELYQAGKPYYQNR